MKRDLSDYSREELDHAIEQWVTCHKRAERNRSILRRSLFDGVCYEKIAEEFDMSVRQIGNIIRKSEDQLFKHL